MESQEPNRIVIEQEKDWIRVRQNLKSVVDGLVDEQLNRPGVSENLELRKQVTRRIQKVGMRTSGICVLMLCFARWQIMEETFSLAVPNLQINGHNYEEYLESVYYPALQLSSHVLTLNRSNHSDRAVRPSFGRQDVRTERSKSRMGN